MIVGEKCVVCEGVEERGRIVRMRYVMIYVSLLLFAVVYIFPCCLEVF